MAGHLVISGHPEDNTVSLINRREQAMLVDWKEGPRYKIAGYDQPARTNI